MLFSIIQDIFVYLIGNCNDIIVNTQVSDHFQFVFCENLAARVIRSMRIRTRVLLLNADARASSSMPLSSSRGTNLEQLLNRSIRPVVLIERLKYYNLISFVYQASIEAIIASVDPQVRVISLSGSDSI